MTHQEHQVLLSQLMQAEEAQRAANAKNHIGSCVPWRGRDGAIGICIYCGTPVDPITAYYSDRAASGQATLTAHR